MWELGTEPGSSAKAVYALNCQASSPTQVLPVFKRTVDRHPKPFITFFLEGDTRKSILPSKLIWVFSFCVNIKKSTSIKSCLKSV